MSLNKPKRLLIDNLPLFVAALFGLLLYIWLFYPGYMSFDSSLQYWQVRTGEWSSAHPVIMQFHWWLTDRLIPGPGGLFIYLQVLFFGALLMIAKYSDLRLWAKLILIVLLSLLPYNLMIMPHLWKDVGMWGYTLLSVGLIMCYSHSLKITHLYLAGTVLLIALLFRVNALAMLLPLIVYWCLLVARYYQKPMSVWFICPAFVVLVLLSSYALNGLSGSKKQTLWPTLAIWDIATVSIAEDKMLLPDFITRGDLTVEHIAQSNVSWSNTPVIQSTQPHGLSTGLFSPFQAQQYQQLRHIWMTLPIDYPSAYFQHRIQLMKDLIGLSSKQGKPHHLMFVNRMVDYKDNPKFKTSDNSLVTQGHSYLKKNQNMAWVNGWLYGLLLIAVVFLRFTRLGRNRFHSRELHELVDVMMLSCLTVLGSLAFMAPAAESRYLIVFVNFSVMAAALMLLPKTKR